jgi:tripartite-type tricarboxylate transporter receptor subunit TctC
MAGMDLVRIPYKGGGAALIDVMGGRVQMAFATAASVTSHIKSGKVRALAVTSREPSALAPGLPTIAAAGVPDYEAMSLYGFFAPAGTPPAIINRLYQDSSRILGKPEVRERMLNTVGESIASTPAQFAATIKVEMAKWGKLIKATGMREE